MNAQPEKASTFVDAKIEMNGFVEKARRLFLVAHSFA